MRRSAMLRLLLGGLLVPGSARAMDYLTPHLESQRYGNQLRRQQRARERARQRRNASGGAANGTGAAGAAGATGTPRQGQGNARPVSMAERQAAWSRHRPEYQRRLLRDGQASADRWLDKQVRAGR